MPWTEKDDKVLWDMCKRGETKEQIAKALQRSPYAIQCRMERMGLLEPEEADVLSLLPPWTLENVQRLIRLHACGCPAEEIAEQINCPVEHIRARLFYMGLTKDAPISLR